MSRARSALGIGRAFPASSAVSYASSFGADENPISESGAWSNSGLDWTAVRTLSGNAIGTKTSANGNFDDSYAKLSGFPADHEIAAVIHKGSPSGYMEVELLLRATDSAHSATTYECFIHHAGSYLSISKWNGALGSYTVLLDQGAGRPNGGTCPTPAHGDTFKARIVGDVISIWLNGSLLATKDIGTDYLGNAIGKLSIGNPGIGFYRDTGSAAATEFGFQSMQAVGL